MTDQDRYIAGVPCWIDTSHADPEAAASFYGELFGWALEDVMPADSAMRYFMARIRGEDVAAIGSQAEGAPPVALWNSYIWVDDADATAAKVRDAGGQVLMAITDVSDAGRMAVCTDTEGAMFCLWQPMRHRGATVVNEPGSLNFNILHTRDLEAARAFYGAVFGWEVLEGEAGTWWVLAAYGDFLESRTPGLRERIGEMGAPARFEEVVAGINRDAGDQPAGWSVVFAVDDADAIAARATELGGRVIAPPADGPWVRMTVLADPEGAIFTASKFVAENKDVAPSSA